MVETEGGGKSPGQLWTGGEWKGQRHIKDIRLSFQTLVPFLLGVGGEKTHPKAGQG